MQKTRHIWLFAIAGISWFALALQLYLMIDNEEAFQLPVLHRISNFLSYFTILSNLLVAISTTTQLRFGNNQFFSRVNVQSAIALYIFIVALVYNLILRKQWKPEGWQLLADNLLHVIVPLTYVVYWWLFTPRKILLWKSIFPWLIFPALYLVYSLIRGEITGWYPYPFLNTGELGYAKVLTNALYVLLAFLAAGALIIGINKIERKYELSR